MPRRKKGPRLYLRAGRTHARTGKPVPDVWVIRDGQTEVSTGCAPCELAGAEKALSEYIAAKWSPRPDGPEGEADPHNPASVFVAEVLTLYLAEKAPRAPDPSGVAARIKALSGYWWEKRLIDVKRSTCEGYVAWRTAQPIASAKDPTTARRVTPQGARRELEDLSAAIGYWDGEHTLTRRPKVTLPEKPDSPRDALTRSQAAALLMAARGYRKGEDGRWTRLQASSRANRAHMPRFILMALYTGTRPGVIPKVLWNESPVQAWADMEDGIIYRRGRREKDHRTKRRPLVKMPDRLLGHMRRWRAADDREQARRRAAQEAAGERPDFTISSVIHHGGRPLTGRIRRAFESCVADAGLDPEITPHWLRHTCATWLMEGDVALWEASAFTGMTTATLEKCYGHHRPDHQQRARKALGKRKEA